LEKGKVRLLKKGKDTVSRAEAVLDPPGLPGRAFHEAIPVRYVEHGNVLELRVWLEQAAGIVQEFKIIEVSPAPEMLAFELI
jgi:hypothetical protein